MRRLAVAACAAIMLLLGVLPTSAVADPVQSATPRNLPTLAYYYQWFAPSSWDRAKVDYPLVGRYSSDDTTVMRRQIDEAKQAGIDGFIVSWKHSAVNDRRLEALMRVANGLDFKLAIIYQGLDFHRNPLPISQVRADFNLFNTKYATDPVFSVFDKPLLIWSGTWKFSAADLDATTRPLRTSLQILATEKTPEAYQRVAQSFDGDAYYWSSVDPSKAGYEAKLQAMSAAVHSSGGLWIAPFAPGFDAHLVGGTRSVPRRNGDTLRTEYSAAVSSSPDALGLISWNEFSENTHVEPSVQQGSTALSVLATLTESGPVSLSPLATDSSAQGSGNKSMTVQTSLVVLLVLFLGITVFSFARRPPKLPPDGDAAPAPARRQRGLRPSSPRLVIAGVVIAAVVITMAVVGRRDSSTADVTVASPLYMGGQPVRDVHDVVIGAAGDISCPTNKLRMGKELQSNSCKTQQTAALLKSITPDAVLPLGDNQYPAGSLTDFQQSYDHSWGAFRQISYPVPGNHEYGTAGAKGYYAYFGARAGDPGKGYYSYDLGTWHLVALNSECEQIGGCSDTSPQAMWLKQDLAAHPRACTLAYWHRPRFSSGNHGNNLDNDVLWRTLAGAGADLVLNGHDHDYERFAPMDAEGKLDTAKGTAEMVVGTGGASHYKFHLPMSTSLSRNTGENGILRLELSDHGYSWQFLRAPDQKVLDSGSAQCH